MVLQRSGLFDGGWFLERNVDLVASGYDPLTHFHRYGWKENRKPNAYFDPAWYVEHNTDVAAGGQDPLLHYVEHGEHEGRQPVAFFDPLWYRQRYAVPRGVLCLTHFLQHRHGGAVSPLPEFDAAHYLARYPDVAAAGMDPFEHYLVQGAAEDREPSAAFDAAFYRERYLRHLPGIVPLLHFRQNRHRPGIHASRPAHDTDIPREVRRNTQPGPLFEDTAPLGPEVPRRAKLLAFYLPQFHAVPENDAWWGRGFTEWTNVARGLPRFSGHYQPRTPRDLGHYTLHGTTVLRRQAEMARAAGLHGFVFYFYWFNGRRLLESPLEALLADRSIELPFCLMWANENWTRRWDGSEHEVLMSQDYRIEDELGLVAEFLRHFADPRYIRLEGRPVLMVYRVGLIPAGAVARWRRLFAEAGEEPVFVMAQSFDDRDPRRFGMDAAVEFPPHKLTNQLEALNPALMMLDHAATARVYAYDDVAAASDLSPTPYPLIRTALPGWDNDARRQGHGMTLHGATPAAYQAWLDRLIGAAQQQPVVGEAIVCINAWNEWGEGAYLEPDVHFGSAFLNATARAVSGVSQVRRRRRMLLVGHDAFPAGAQLLLLHLGQVLRDARGFEVSFLLLGGGALLPQYQQVAPTILLQGAYDLARQVEILGMQGFDVAIVNTSAAAGLLPVLSAGGIACTLLVHELPRLLQQRGLVEPVREAVAAARDVVFGAVHVRDRLAELVRLDLAHTAVLPQGIYRPVQPGGAARRAQLGLPKGVTLAVGMGYADLRKGFDLFLQAWRQAQHALPGTHFLWVGDIDPGLHAHLGAEMAAATAAGTFHHFPFTPDGGDWLAAADVLLLTSREDPLPTVVLEAMSVGVPTIAFEDSGGIPDLLRDCTAGVSVPLGDVPAMVAAMPPLLARFRGVIRTRLANRARRLFDFDDYAGRLVALACPRLPEVSVVVPSYNYGRFLPERLASIFAQTCPVREIIVLDDASSDDSVAVARRVAQEAGRRIRLVTAARNSGSVFAQWHRAARMAQGEWLWIAEADDLSEPDFLTALCRAVHTAPDAVMAFSDSRAIDAEGTRLWPDHQAYYARSGARLLAADGVFDAAEVLRTCLAERNLILNVSGVLFRRAALLAALDRCAPELATFEMAGDWRLYAELLHGGGRVAYVAEPLNVHRRHGASVTHRMPVERHLHEVERMHRHMRGVVGRRRGLVRGQRQALAQAREALETTAAPTGPARRQS
ncbi:MAG: glycoside hydrolase family 99-like domain-containing protein [Janthinobacterium lividum]